MQSSFHDSFLKFILSFLTSDQINSEIYEVMWIVSSWERSEHSIFTLTSNEAHEYLISLMTWIYLNSDRDSELRRWRRCWIDYMHLKRWTMKQDKFIRKRRQRALLKYFIDKHACTFMQVTQSSTFCDMTCRNH